MAAYSKTAQIPYPACNIYTAQEEAGPRAKPRGIIPAVLVPQTIPHSSPPVVLEGLGQEKTVPLTVPLLDRLCYLPIKSH